MKRFYLKKKVSITEIKRKKKRGGWWSLTYLRRFHRFSHCFYHVQCSWNTANAWYVATDERYYLQAPPEIPVPWDDTAALHDPRTGCHYKAQIRPIDKASAKWGKHIPYAKDSRPYDLNKIGKGNRQCHPKCHRER